MIIIIQPLHSLLQSFSVLHTSASLALNESWDPDVRSEVNRLVQLEQMKLIFQYFSFFFRKPRDDMEMMLNKIVPEGLPYRHSCEGPDDMVGIIAKIPKYIIIIPYFRYR